MTHTKEDIKTQLNLSYQAIGDILGIRRQAVQKDARTKPFSLEQLNQLYNAFRKGCNWNYIAIIKPDIEERIGVLRQQDRPLGEILDQPWEHLTLWLNSATWLPLLMRELAKDYRRTSDDTTRYFDVYCNTQEEEKVFNTLSKLRMKFQLRLMDAGHTPFPAPLLIADKKHILTLGDDGFIEAKGATAQANMQTSEKSLKTASLLSEHIVNNGVVGKLAPAASSGDHFVESFSLKSGGSYILEMYHEPLMGWMLRLELHEQIPAEHGCVAIYDQGGRQWIDISIDQLPLEEQWCFRGQDPNGHFEHLVLEEKPCPN